MLAMPIGTKTSTLPKDNHDAPRPPRTSRDEPAAREGEVGEVSPGESILDDPYDNVACTD